MTPKEFMQLIVKDLQKLGFGASVQDLRPNINPPFINIVAPEGGIYFFVSAPLGFKLLACDEFQTVIAEIYYPLELIAPAIRKHIARTEGVNA